MKDEVKMIPIASIRIINPRARDRKKFEVIVQSIRNLGLKKPIQVSLRTKGEDDEPGYDLVCGQGRIEAYTALGFIEIPAIVVEISKEERLLRSLIENMARRFPAPADLLQEIERLKAQGLSNTAIGKKIDVSDTVVGGFLALKKAGEERLLDSALKGKIPLGVAMDIARAETAEAQRELLKAYEGKQLNQASIRVVKRLIDQRKFLGKQRGNLGRPPSKTATTADGFVNAYRRESQKQKIQIKKGKICEAKLVFVVQAFAKLTADENFTTLLRAEGLTTMPKWLVEQVRGKIEEAA